MTRLFTITTAVLTLIIGVLVGVLVSVPRSVQPVSKAPASAMTSRDGAPEPAETAETRPLPNGSLNFADIAARLNRFDKKRYQELTKQGFHFEL